MSISPSSGQGCRPKRRRQRRTTKNVQPIGRPRIATTMGTPTVIRGARSATRRDIVKHLHGVVAETCYTCVGTGTVAEHLCPACAGSGVAVAVCYTCEGIGKVDYLDGTHTCPNCAGSCVV
jgi:hypothetical protein